MTDIPAEIARLGGAAKAIELLHAGATRASIRRTLRAGLITRPRKGWYVLPTTPLAVRGAIRVGGRATCVTALREHNVWVTDIHQLVHVAVHRSASQLRSVAHAGVRQATVPDAVVHWRDTPKPRLAVGSRLVEPVLTALMDARDCLSSEDLFASAESVRRLGLTTSEDWNHLLQRMPRAVRRVLATAGTKSDSGLESLAAFRLRRRRLRVRQQVQIGMDRVDILIGTRLVVELDGGAFHNRYADYRRDTRLVAAGYIVLRFDYDQVLYEWGSIVRAIDAVVARGHHVA
jgi:very-short-patch-repair endonuclease